MAFIVLDIHSFRRKDAFFNLPKNRENNEASFYSFRGASCKGQNFQEVLYINVCDLGTRIAFGQYKFVLLIGR